MISVGISGIPGDGGEVIAKRDGHVVTGGRGIAGVDDSSVLSAAFRLSKLVCSEGDFTLTAPISLTDHVWDGLDSTTLHIAVDRAINLVGDATRDKRHTIQNMKIVGDKAYTAIGQSGNHLFQTILKNVHFSKVRYAADLGIPESNMASYYTTIDSCNIADCMYGVRFYAGNGSLVNNSWFETDGAAYQSYAGEDLVIRDSFFEIVNSQSISPAGVLCDILGSVDVFNARLENSMLGGFHNCRLFKCNVVTPGVAPIISDVVKDCEINVAGAQSVDVILVPPALSEQKKFEISGNTINGVAFETAIKTAAGPIRPGTGKIANNWIGSGAIMLQDVAHVVIEGNHITPITTSGLITTPSALQVTARDNSFEGIGWYFPNTRVGIDLHSSSGLIENNTFEGESMMYGLLIADGAGNNKIIYNQFKGNFGTSAVLDLDYTNVYEKNEGI